MLYSKKLKELRIKNNLKQSDLSDYLNIQRGTYSQYESEYIIIPIKHLISLCDYLNISVDYVFNLNSDEKYKKEKIAFDLKLSSTRLKEFRKENKLSQVKLAEFLNTDNSTISKYEQARNPIATPFLYEICSKFNISADYLLGKIDNPKYLK